MNWKKRIQQEVAGNKYPTLRRIKAGKVLAVIVALPLGTLWLAPVAAAMVTPIKPSLWALDKMKSLNGSKNNPKLWIRGRLNERKGNGDLLK